MQFVVTGYDGTDEQALARRLAVREAHIASIDKMRNTGNMLFGAAILDDHEKMIGSMIVCDVASRQELDEWLKIEPYVVGNVWHKIEIKRCKVGPSFVGSPQNR